MNRRSIIVSEQGHLLTSFLVALFLLCSSATGLAQIESLTASHSPSISDTTEVGRLIELTKVALEEQEDSMASVHASAALEISERADYPKGIAMAERYLGLVSYYSADYGRAVVKWNNSLKHYEMVGDSSNVARLLSNLGAVYFNEGNYESALELYLNSQKVAEEVGDTARLISAFTNIGAIYGLKSATYELAIDYYLRGLTLAESIHDDYVKGTMSTNVAEVYMAMKDHYLNSREDSVAYLKLVKHGLVDSLYHDNAVRAIELDSLAERYFKDALAVFSETENEAFVLTGIGKLYMNRNQFDLALEYQQRALEVARDNEAPQDISESLLHLGETYNQMGEYEVARRYYSESLALAQDKDYPEAIALNHEGLAETYARAGNFKRAYTHQKDLTAMREKLNDIASQQKLQGMTFQYDIDKQNTQIDLLHTEKQLQQAEIENEKLVKNISLIGLGSILAIAFILLRMYRTKVKTNKVLDGQRKQIKNLLLNTLPADVVRELEEEGVSVPKSYESVTVLFTDFKGFTRLAADLTPIQLIGELTTFFTAFDDIMGKYGIEKIKTIGDAYMCAGGVPNPMPDHAEKTVLAGLEIQRYMGQVNKERDLSGLPPWELRVGVHTGPVVAGVVGKKKYAYDIWGDAVNTASRMESNGEAGRVNVSQATYDLVKDRFDCQYRGKISAKNIGEIDMYFVEEVDAAVVA